MGINLDHLSALPDNQRIVLSRWAIDGVSMRQLAKERGISQPCIYKTIARARVRLKAIASRLSTASAA
jgi:DNA-directed RNA polymerase specialized sigma24 family protein